jgi:hypothetical protein
VWPIGVRDDGEGRGTVRLAETAMLRVAEVGAKPCTSRRYSPRSVIAAWMFEACIPLGPLVASKVTF